MIEAPNILFLFPDQWRGDWLPRISSPYGSPRLQCPNVEELIARGTQFTQCRTNSPLCVPARARLAQGMRYGRCGVWTNADTLDPLRPNFLHELRRHSYRVMSAGKNDLHGHHDHFTDSGWSAQLGKLGFTEAVNQRGKLNSARRSDERPGPYVAHLRAHDLLEAHRQDYADRHTLGGHGEKAPFPTPLLRFHYTGDFCGRMALDLLNRTSRDAPWFFWVNFPGPHDPHDAPQELLDRFADRQMPDPHAPEDDPTIAHQQLRRNYAASMSGIDDWVGRLMDAVDARGERDNTLVIFASDHGEMLGDHARWAKSTWREPSVRVPLLVAGPGIDAGRQSEELVELIDVAALIQQSAGIDPVPDWDTHHPFTDPRGFQHSSLVGEGENADWTMVTDGRWKYVIDKNDDRATHLLFDLENDPCEDTSVLRDNPGEHRRLQQLMSITEK